MGKIMETNIVCSCTSADSPILNSLLLPLAVAVISYILFDRLGEWRKRRSYSRLGEAIIDSLIEEVRSGQRTLKACFEYLASPNNNPPVNALPRRSWSGMNTIPDDVLLRIIEISEGKTTRGFPAREIRIHCKNYFEYITSTWDIVVEKFRTAQNWVPEAQQLLSKARLHEAAEGVLQMLEDTKTLLAKNAKSLKPR